jgi:hypothetical protein
VIDNMGREYKTPLVMGMDGTLYAGGDFTTKSHAVTDARWDGTAWLDGESPVGSCRWCGSRLDTKRSSPSCPQCGGPNKQ